MGTNSSKDLSKVNFHTKISSQDHRLLKLLALKYRCNIQNIVEQAIQLLRVKESLRDESITILKNEIDLYQLQHMMLQDFHMVAVGRTTFSSLIDSIPTNPIKNNNASELIEWFHNDTPLDQLSLSQILQAIKKLWISGNYFTQIDIQPIIDFPQAYKIVFSHDFDKVYGKYWTEYFKYFFSHDPLNFEIQDIAIHHQRFRMEIYEMSPRLKLPSNHKPKETPGKW